LRLATKQDDISPKLLGSEAQDPVDSGSVSTYEKEQQLNDGGNMERGRRRQTCSEMQRSAASASPGNNLTWRLLETFSWRYRPGATR
jgi:hypothetical protein